MNLEILTRDDLTVKQIAQLLNCSTSTVCRKRKEHGISIKRGCKSGVSKPNSIKREERSCLTCLKLFSVIPSSSKRYCCLSCSSKAIDRSYMQSDEYRCKVSKETTPAYRKYASLVHRLSKKTYEKYKHIINPNNYPRTVCGVEGGWQLDHIISIKEGYNNGLSPEKLASVDNLRMLPWKENLMRNYEHTV